MRVPIAEFAPDQPALDSGVTGYVNNVVPLSQSYGPIKTVGAVGNALGTRCQGADSFRSPGGVVANFAGDSTKLYKWDGTAWNDVSRLAGGAYTIASTDFWDFEQFSGVVVAANGTDALQAWTLDSSANFAALAGSPPVARFVSTIRDFLVVARVSSAENRVQWPDISSTTAWASGQADSQDLPIGGRIMGLAGGNEGLVLSESALHRMIYVGTPAIFEFQPISRILGCAAEGSVAQNGDRTYFWAYEGFFAVDGAQVVTPIGGDKVKDYVANNINPEYLSRVISAVDPITRNYWFAFPSRESASGTVDTQIIYSPTTNRFSRASLAFDYIFSARTNLGYTIDTIDSLYGNLDAITVSLDAPELSGSPKQTFAVFGTDKKMGFFSGTNMAATVDTVEAQIYEDSRSFVDAARVLVDGGTPSVAIGTRNNQTDSVTWSTAVAQNDVGECPFNVDEARYHRGRITTVSGDTWSHIQGIDVRAFPTGNR